MADEYERKYMGADGALFHERKLNPRAIMALVGGLLGLGFGVASMLSSAPSLAVVIPAALAGGLFATVYVGGIALVFLWIRSVVTREALHVQMGPFGPKVPVSAITRIEKIGWFGRRAFEPSFAALGAKALARVSYRGANGKERSFVVGTDDLEGLQRAIAEAQSGAAAPSAAVQVRVDPSIEAPLEAEPDAAVAEKRARAAS